MEFLPSPEEREWLVDALEGLLRSQGAHQFLSMPLVEPTPRFFPDPWSFSLEGLDRVVRRLMQYACLGDLKVHVGTFDQPGLGTTKPGIETTRSVAGLFLGLDSGCAHFAFNERAPSDGEYMAGVMAHEVGHAYRTFHSLSSGADSQREEWLTDVTAAYLGFGILLANNSYRYRTAGEQVGYLSRHTWSVGRTGYLSPQAFAYLLAIQVEARGLDDVQKRRVLSLLEANQAAFTRAATDSILTWPDENFRRLQFPYEGDTVREVPPESILVPLPEVEEVAYETDRSDEVPTEALINHGRPVFRLTESRALPYSAAGLLAGLPLGALGIALLHIPLLAGVFPIAGLAFGWKKGSRVRHDVCSDSECKSVLEPRVTTCPGCGGTVAGSIRRPSEHLAAAEEYELRNSPKRRGRPMKRRKRTSSRR